MSTTILTSAWDAVILNFSPVFTQPTAQIFINLITGWILCTTRRTITGILPFAEPKNKRPHDAYHRLFPKSRWLPAHLWKLLAQMLIGLFYPAGTVWMDMDDTIFHRTGRKVDGAGWWRDAIRSTALLHGGPRPEAIPLLPNCCVSTALKLEIRCPHCHRKNGNIHCGIQYRFISDTKFNVIGESARQ